MNFWSFLTGKKLNKEEIRENNFPEVTTISSIPKVQQPKKQFSSKYQQKAFRREISPGVYRHYDEYGGAIDPSNLIFYLLVIDAITTDQPQAAEILENTQNQTEIYPSQEVAETSSSYNLESDSSSNYDSGSSSDSGGSDEGSSD